VVIQENRGAVKGLQTSITLMSKKGSESSNADSALEVLKKSYAQGEISKEEYEEKKKDLA
jgi:uncharacterized membrane protein